MEERKAPETDQVLRQKVLENFFQDGKLKAMPVKRKKRLIVLEEILKRFECGRTYSEKEVNSIITEVFDDYCTVRREMVEARMLGRNQGGYWRPEAE